MIIACDWFSQKIKIKSYFLSPFAYIFKQLGESNKCMGMLRKISPTVWFFHSFDCIYQNYMELGTPYLNVSLSHRIIF